MSSVLTWTDAPPETGRRSRRLRRLAESHHAMWNYLTYRDAIRVLELDADELYPDGATRLDPAVWADLGWLTCFAGPPQAAVTAMREAVSRETLNQYTPDLIEPLRDAAAHVLGRERDASFEVVGTEGAQAALALALLARVDPGDEVIVGDPGYFHIPSAVIVAGGVPVPVRLDASYRLDPAAVAAAVTPRTRAICVVDPVNPYGTVQTEAQLLELAELAERRDLLLIHDVTHALLRIDPGPAAEFRSLPALRATDNAVAVFSVSHCYGMAGARLGFLAGAPGLMRDCLRLKAGLTRLNTSLVAQRGALAALEDEAYLDRAGEVVRDNLEHLERTLANGAGGVSLAVRPVRGLACGLDVAGTGTSAQELMVALFARRVAVYPGDGLGDAGAATTVRLNLSRPDAWAMEHFRAVLGPAVEEAASGRWREPVIALLEGKGTARAAAVAAEIRARR